MPARIDASPLSRAWLIGSCQFQQRAGLEVTFCAEDHDEPSVSATSLKPRRLAHQVGPVDAAVQHQQQRQRLLVA
jgi:hypothetical protein